MYLMQEEGKLELLRQKRENYIFAKQEAMSDRLNLRLIAEMQRGIEATDDQIEMQKLRVKKAEKGVELAESRLREAMTDRKTQERLRENAFEQYKREFEAEERKEVDELVSYTFSSRDEEET